ncbi:U4/U6 small nuclear ribonucleoprotein Prp3-like [Corticium candelabrum]|uniref:U4/U6 small nuclear ribonucleoprotein Prp3-like n=1 Tax=Corticium candelabrum TaxID=121492 RepID=UPI002E27150C|nr:U4/U6 small nuclear ribonucleoprotein Prp3-like [Corticium candelabrum]
MALSRQELDELRPYVSSITSDVLGFPETAVVSAAMDCVSKNLEKEKIALHLRTLLDDLAPSFVDKLSDKVEQIKQSRTAGESTGRKRKREGFSEAVGDSGKEPKKRLRTRFDLNDEDISNVPYAVEEPVNAAGLTRSQIDDVMETTMKQIEARKQQLQIGTGVPSVVGGGNVLQSATSAGMHPISTPAISHRDALMQEAVEKARKAAELNAKIQQTLAAKPSLLSNLGAAKLISDPEKLLEQAKPAPLILDDKGRTVDESGKAIQLTRRIPTLKANIRAKKQELFKMEKPKVEDTSQNPYYDLRVRGGFHVRSKRSFTFHEKGKFEQLAQKLRAKAQLEKLQSEISSVSKKSSISTATRLALIAPNQEDDDPIPDVEWWDAVILPNETYADIVINITDGRDPISTKYRGITNLIEHPIQRRPPAEPRRVVPLPIIMTKKERKKLRSQRRRDVEKEKQEKIQLGLEPPPPPKVKISNLMRVLGNEAIQDPTKIEAHVRAQMAERQRKHEEANAARKLTKDERKAKVLKKIIEDTSLGVHVAVFRVRDLSNPAHKFKVDMNAQQYHLTGCTILFKDVNLVIVEGGPKALKKYKKLMLHRVKWEQQKKGRARDSDKQSSEENKCDLVWEGTNKERSFIDWKIKQVAAEVFARDHLRKYGVEHYWDLALSRSIVEEDDKE